LTVLASGGPRAGAGAATPAGAAETPFFRRALDYAPHAVLVVCVLALGAGAATFATAPALTSDPEPIAGLDARSLGPTFSVDDGEERRKAETLAREVGALKGQIVRLQRALDQSKAAQAGLSKSSAEKVAAGQEEVKALRADLASLQKTLDAARQASAAKLDELAAKLDQPKEDAARLAELRERLDRVEKSAAQTPDDPVTTGSVASDASAQVVRNWTVRDVYDGVALISGRRGTIEVERGATVPGVGRIKAIERRGGEWVVVTERGVILQR
jgi:seryl-tRNA synthetase